MSIITQSQYKAFSDEDKLSLLQLLYHDLKGVPHKVRERALIQDEAERVYHRMRSKPNGH